MPEAEYTNDQGEHDPKRRNEREITWIFPFKGAEMKVKLHEFFLSKEKKNAKSQSTKWLHKPITTGRGMFLPGH